MSPDNLSDAIKTILAIIVEHTRREFACKTLHGMLGFGKVRRPKLIQLQRVAGSEDQVIEITYLLKEILNVALIREITRVPFRFSVERCDRLFKPGLRYSTR